MSTTSISEDGRHYLILQIKQEILKMNSIKIRKREVHLRLGLLLQQLDNNELVENSNYFEMSTSLMYKVIDFFEFEQLLIRHNIPLCNRPRNLHHFYAFPKSLPGDIVNNWISTLTLARQFAEHEVVSMKNLEQAVNSLFYSQTLAPCNDTIENDEECKIQSFVPNLCENDASIEHILDDNEVNEQHEMDLEVNQDRSQNNIVQIDVLSSQTKKKQKRHRRKGKRALLKLERERKFQEEICEVKSGVGVVDECLVAEYVNTTSVQPKEGDFSGMFEHQTCIVLNQVKSGLPSVEREYRRTETEMKQNYREPHYSRIGSTSCKVIDTTGGLHVVYIPNFVPSCYLPILNQAIQQMGSATLGVLGKYSSGPYTSADTKHYLENDFAKVMEPILVSLEKIIAVLLLHQHKKLMALNPLFVPFLISHAMQVNSNCSTSKLVKGHYDKSDHPQLFSPIIVGGQSENDVYVRNLGLVIHTKPGDLYFLSAFYNHHAVLPSDNNRNSIVFFNHTGIFSIRCCEKEIGAISNVGDNSRARIQSLLEKKLKQKKPKQKNVI